MVGISWVLDSILGSSKPSPHNQPQQWGPLCKASPGECHKVFRISRTTSSSNSMSWIHLKNVFALSSLRSMKIRVAGGKRGVKFPDRNPDSTSDCFTTQSLWEGAADRRDGSSGASINAPRWLPSGRPRSNDQDYGLSSAQALGS